MLGFSFFINACKEKKKYNCKKISPAKSPFFRIPHIHMKSQLTRIFTRKTLNPNPIISAFSIPSAVMSSSSPSTASVKLVAEYAKSGRSSCKKCSKSIAASALRFGLVTKDPRGFDMTKWHHLNCVPFGASGFASSVDAITGFSSLKV